MPNYSATPTGRLAQCLGQTWVCCCHTHGLVKGIRLSSSQLIARQITSIWSSDAVKLIDSYLSDRSQQIRMGSNTSGWETLTKGVP